MVVANFIKDIYVEINYFSIADYSDIYLYIFKLYIFADYPGRSRKRVNARVG